MIELVLIAGAVLLAAACIWGRPDPEDEFRRQCAAAGKDFAETQDAIYIRIAFACSCGGRHRISASPAMATSAGSTLTKSPGCSPSAWGPTSQRSPSWHGFSPAGRIEILYEDARALNLRYFTSKLTPIKPDPQIAADIKAAFRNER